MKNTQEGFAFLPVILIVAAVLAIGGGTYYYSENKDASQEVEAEIETNANVSTQTDATKKDNKSEPDETTQTIKTVVTNQPAASGLSPDVALYADANFGYRFYYPKSWKLTNTSNKVSLTNFGPYYDDTLSITEVTGAEIKNEDAKFGSVIYYFDVQSGSWIVNADGAEKAMEAPTHGPQKAVPAFSTTSGLPVFGGVGRWATYIVPLSPSKFLVVNITGSGFTDVLTPITKTISLSSNSGVSAAVINDLITTAINKEGRSSTHTNIDTSVTTTTKWQTYTDPQHRFSLQYPANWLITHKSQDALQIADRYIPGPDFRASTVEIRLNDDIGPSYDWKYYPTGLTGSFYNKRVSFQNAMIYIMASALTEDDKKTEDQILASFTVTP